MSELTAFAQRGHEPPDVIVIAGGGEVQQPTQEAPEHRLRAIMASLGQAPWNSADFAFFLCFGRVVSSTFWQESCPPFVLFCPPHETGAHGGGARRPAVTRIFRRSPLILGPKSVLGSWDNTMRGAVRHKER